MRVKLQLVISHDDGHEETVTDVITLTKNHQRIEHLGLSLAESKQLLGTLQRHILQQQGKRNKKVAVKLLLGGLTVLHLDLCSPTPHSPSTL